MNINLLSNSSGGYIQMDPKLTTLGTIYKILACFGPIYGYLIDLHWFFHVFMSRYHVALMIAAL